MANYKEIQGFPIQNLSSDPVPYAQELADNPYAGVWSSGGNVNEPRSQLGGVGTQTEALMFGGNHGGGTPEVGFTEEYNGSSWTEVADLNSSRRLLQGMGTVYTSAFAVGGYMPPGYQSIVESWNGTSWTETTDTNSNKGAGGQSGTSTAGIAFAGVPGGPMATNEEWNGSTWTELADLNTGRRNTGSAGTTSTAALLFGGNYPPGNTGLTEQWNGSSWTEVGDLNTVRVELAGAGTSTSALGTGGGSPAKTNSESFDGTSWTEVNDLSTARLELNAQASNSSTSALAFNGATAPGGPYPGVTEEWSFSGLPPSTPAADYSDAIVGQMYYNSTTGQFKAIKDGGAPIGTWASGGTMNQSKSSQANIGSSTANNSVGGQIPSPAYLTNNEQYDGTSWTEVNDLSTGRQVGSGIGTSAAGLIAGGRAAPNSTAVVESWDGTNFTEVGDLNQARGYARGAGTQTAAINVGGYLTTPAVRYSIVEEWNGSAWTEIADLNAPRSSGGIAQASPYTSTIVFGGDTGPGPTTTSSIATAETWNGSSWTEVADMNSGRRALGGAGDSINSAIAFGGSSVNTEFWNGSSWTEVNNLSDARSWGGNSGSTNDALVSGDEPFSGATEEWTAAEFEIKTMTTS